MRVGEDAARPRGTRELDAKGALVTPGLIDWLHRTVIFAGDRAHVFELRAAGATYQEIAAACGGIAATAPADARGGAPHSTRCSPSDFRDQPRGGTTTIEIKTGYALTLAAELLSCSMRTAACRRPSIRSS